MTAFPACLAALALAAPAPETLPNGMRLPTLAPAPAAPPATPRTVAVSVAAFERDEDLNTAARRLVTAMRDAGFRRAELAFEGGVVGDNGSHSVFAVAAETPTGCVGVIVAARLADTPEAHLADTLRDRLDAAEPPKPSVARGFANSSSKGASAPPLHFALNRRPAGAASARFGPAACELALLKAGLARRPGPAPAVVGGDAVRRAVTLVAPPDAAGQVLCVAVATAGQYDAAKETAERLRADLLRILWE